MPDGKRLDVVPPHLLGFGHHLLQDLADSFSLGGLEGLDAETVDQIGVAFAGRDLSLGRQATNRLDAHVQRPRRLVVTQHPPMFAPRRSDQPDHSFTGIVPSVNTDGVWEVSGTDEFAAW